MPNTYFDSDLTGEQIEAALNAIHGVVTPENNGLVLAIEDGEIVAKSASEWTDTPALEPLSVTANGDYTPGAGVDGYNSVHVAVPGAGNIQPLSVTENGTYNPGAGVDGYAPVTVNVSGGVSDNDLLFHFDDFTNSGKMNAAFYNKTGYLISDEQSKFGGTSLKVASAPSTGGAVYFESGFTFGNQDFTLDFWFYTTNTTSAQCVLSFNYRSLGLYVNSYTNVGSNLASSSGSWAVTRSVTLQQSIANSWHHLAFVRNGSEFYYFIDGVKLDTFEWSGSFAPMTRMSFGTNSNDQTSWRGYIDEFRLKIGEAVWTSEFTPPTEPYT